MFSYIFLVTSVTMFTLDLDSDILPKVEPLTEINYHTWKFDARFVLMEKGLWRVVSGEEREPVNTVTSTEASDSASVEAGSSKRTSKTPPAQSTPTTTSADVIAWKEKKSRAVGILGQLVSEHLKHHLEPY